MTDTWVTDYESQRQDRLRQALSAGCSATASDEPTNLLTELSATGVLLASLHNSDKWNAYADLLYAEFGAPELCKEPLSENWRRLLAWALDVLQQWTPKADPKHLKLLAAFTVFTGLDAGPWYWHLLPPEVEISAELETFLRTRLPTSLGEIQTTSRAELWEAELVAKLQRADAEGDWDTLEQHWQTTERLADVLATPLVGCFATLLARSSLEAFVDATDSVEGFLACYALLERLNLEQRLSVALATRQPAASLAAVISSSLNRTVVLKPKEQKLMEQVFIKTARSINDWRKWMTILNRYPVRRPAIQEALGAALTEVSDEARQVYCDSIVLSAVNDGDMSRLAVGVCLGKFREGAPEATRHKLWAHFKHRWAQWDFGRSTPDQLLLSTVRSQIDYAVIAYYAECLDGAARQQVVDEVLEHLNRIGSIWHRDRHAYENTYYGLLSALQPCCTAHLRTPIQWLDPHQQYEPTLESAAARYRNFHLRR